MFVGASGSTIFVALPNHWITIFSLGVTLMREVGIVQETSAYLLSVYALSVPDVPVRQALCDYAYTLASARLGSSYSCTAMVGIAAQVHVGAVLPVQTGLTWRSVGLRWKVWLKPWRLLLISCSHMAIMSSQLVGSCGDRRELTILDVVSLDVSTQLFASRPLQWQAIRSKYTALRPVASSGMNMFLSIREFDFTDSH